MDDRPWDEKWWFVIDGLAHIESMYEGHMEVPVGVTPSNLHIRAFVNRFCGDCWDMKDWIKKDPDVPQKARDDVMSWVNRRGSRAKHIRIAGHVVNTFKHRDRDLHLSLIHI